jgi:hypothetical protein
MRHKINRKTTTILKMYHYFSQSNRKPMTVFNLYVTILPATTGMFPGTQAALHVKDFPYIHINKKYIKYQIMSL